MESLIINIKLFADSIKSFQPFITCLFPDYVTPSLLQFKTNYFDIDIAEQKANALVKTIKYFEL